MENIIDESDTFNRNELEDHPVASGITAIDKASVHRICSGQVVLTLATAVKELVENSVDAGATTVEVKLKEHGSESIEVSDNGDGVEEANFQGLIFPPYIYTFQSVSRWVNSSIWRWDCTGFALKHHTSKLQDFADLINVQTFGFRGEALSSLCALGDMSISTRHKDVGVATRLDFDHHGNITKKTRQARQVGTTVTIQNLFYTLPVRHKEFQRNVKKEFVKMVQVLNSYCVISTGVRLTCTNLTGKGNRSTVVSTEGNSTLRENIANIFGPKQMQGLLEFQQKLPGEDVCSEFGINRPTASVFRMEGYVSKCDHGLGRSSTDRQFYFINGRPFDSNKLCKVVNEVYHQYNRHQYPFVALSLTMEKETVDVNVTPDKRQVFMQGEKALLAIVKASLVAMYEPTTSVLQMQLPSMLKRTATSTSTGCCSTDATDTDVFSETSGQGSSTGKQESGMTSLMKLKRSFTSAFAKTEEVESPRTTDKQRRLDSFVSRNSVASPSGNQVTMVTELNHESEDSFSLKNDTGSTNLHRFDPNKDNTGDTIINPHNLDISVDKASDVTMSDDLICGVGCYGDKVQENLNINSNLVQHCTSVSVDLNCDTDCESHSAGGMNNTPCRTVNCDVNEQSDDINRNVGSSPSTENSNHFKSYSCTTIKCTKESEISEFESTRKSNSSVLDSVESSVSSADPDSLRDQVLLTDHNSLSDQVSSTDTHSLSVPNLSCNITHHQLDEKQEVSKAERTVQFSLDSLKSKITKTKREDDSKKTLTSRSFRATISPTENATAEQELQKEIKKEMFDKMEILGQFNLGFIITKLGDDLFIIDQHATDEKYNFETLKRDTVIQSQRLICPLNLELTASSEVILIDNIEIFKKNGFDFLISEQELPGQRVKLVSTPVSKNWNFGKEDIEEMVFMLTDSPGVTCRPSRVRAMFASRACRKSIMIGTALSKQHMRKLVSQMGKIEQPWNCPHGRPTMRHLINLNMLPE